MFFYIEGDSDAVGEQALVEILKKRFLAKKIYVGVQYSNKLSLWNYLGSNIFQTYASNILISINPFEKFLNVYEPSNMVKYIGKKRGELPPHIYAIGTYFYNSFYLF